MTHKAIRVSGLSTGDNECWCLEVTEEMFRSVVGESAWGAETHWREKLVEQNAPWLLYPDAILDALGYGPDEQIDIEITRLDSEE